MDFILDKLNDFGTLSAAGNFPNVIDLGDGTIERMTVVLKAPDGPLGDTDTVTLSVLGCDTEGGTYTAIVTGVATTGKDLRTKGYGLVVPRNDYRFIKASVAGTFTGTVQALVDSYLGK